MRFKTFANYFFRKKIFIGDLYFLFIFLKKSFFLLNSTLILKSNCITSRIVNQNINMKNCLISIVSSNDHGGAIYILNTVVSLNINDTTFFDCKSNGQGGAIYFNNGLHSSLLRVCALYCKGSNINLGQFSFIKTNNNNNVEYVSISRCYNGWSSIYLENGIQYITNINSSRNINSRHSGICYWNPNSMYTIHCTFYNNNVSEQICIVFYGNSGNMLRSNIVKNNSPLW